MHISLSKLLKGFLVTIFFAVSISCYSQKMFKTTFSEMNTELKSNPRVAKLLYPGTGEILVTYKAGIEEDSGLAVPVVFFIT